MSAPPAPVVVSAAPTTDAEEAPAQPLSNKDFRALLESQRKAAADAVGSAKGKDEADADESGMTAEEIKAAKSTKKKARQESYRKWMEKKAAKEAEHNKYRNRAKERRQDANPDYKDMEGFEEMDAATSKYLGGDIQRTHLVKGLDEALLHKVQEEQEREEELRLEQEYAEAQKRAKAANQGKVITTDSSGVLSVATQSAFAKSLLSAVQQWWLDDTHMAKPPSSSSSSSSATPAPSSSSSTPSVPTRTVVPITNFLPGRTTFDFDLDPQFSVALPTTLVHSLEDMSAQSAAKVSGFVPQDIRAKISKAINFGVKQTQKKKGAVSGPSSSAASAMDVDHSETDGPSTGQPAVRPRAGATLIDEDAEFDIFAGVGRYTSSDAKNSTGPPAVVANPLANLVAPRAGFTLFEAGKEGSLEAKKAPVENKVAVEDAVAAAEAKKSSSNASQPSASATKKPLKLQPLAPIASLSMKRKQVTDASSGAVQSKVEFETGEDEYAECYPSFYSNDNAAAAYDSDEEDLSHMDQGAENQQKKRWDFETEEEWQEYNQNRETLPKAAFQFGQKMNDGRVSKKHKQKAGEKDKDAQFERDFHIIQQLINKKKSEKGGGAGGGGGGSVPAAQMSKRQRILTGNR